MDRKKKMGGIWKVFRGANHERPMGWGTSERQTKKKKKSVSRNSRGGKGGGAGGLPSLKKQ